ncbi:NHL domain-containing protein [Striga asiatica]|uniref:NHL domain-containing protein n=1 Tax=Striga asiatica TaxID=4170 RepID=A0A5A7QVB0_STRAF|nr:NHL domain-containing protein [Striga asiatica]
MEDDAILASPSSLKHRLRQSLCFSCCFRRRHIHLHPPPPQPSDGSPVLVWVGIKGPHELSMSEIKEKCRAMLGLSAARHKRHSSAEFSYDPLSYALNFEDGSNFDDEAPLRNFSAKFLPVPAAVS